MEAVPLNAYLVLSAFLFTMGTIGVVVKRNPIVMFMCIELMLNAANLAFVAFARYQTDLLTQVSGHIFVLFVFGIAAAEVAVGLGIIVVIFRLRESIDVDEVSLLRG